MSSDREQNESAESNKTQHGNKANDQIDTFKIFLRKLKYIETVSLINRMVKHKKHVFVKKWDVPLEIKPLLTIALYDNECDIIQSDEIYDGYDIYIKEEEIKKIKQCLKNKQYRVYMPTQSINSMNKIVDVDVSKKNLYSNNQSKIQNLERYVKENDTEQQLNNNTTKNSEYRDTLELREKRLNIVFKVFGALFVVWMALLLHMGSGFGDENIKFPYIIESVLVSGLTLCAFHIISYIISEMKCFNLTEDIFSSQWLQLAEAKYTKMVNCVYISAVMAFVLPVMYIEIMENINYKYLFLCFIFTIIALLCLFLLTLKANKQKEMLLYGLINIIFIIMFSLLLIMFKFHIALEVKQSLVEFINIFKSN